MVGAMVVRPWGLPGHEPKLGEIRLSYTLYGASILAFLLCYVAARTRGVLWLRLLRALGWWLLSWGSAWWIAVSAFKPLIPRAPWGGTGSASAAMVAFFGGLPAMMLGAIFAISAAMAEKSMRERDSALLSKEAGDATSN